MIIQVTYLDGHHEVFDSNSLTGGSVFGRSSVMTEFDVVWERGDRGSSLVVYAHHMEDPGRSTDDESAEGDRIRGPRLVLVDACEAADVDAVYMDGRPLAWSQGECLVDAFKFEEACRRWYSGPMGASANARAVALFGYLERARPELAGDEERICPLFGFTPEAYRAAEDDELAQAGPTMAGEEGWR